jgi:hypothetical protein
MTEFIDTPRTEEEERLKALEVYRQQLLHEKTWNPQWHSQMDFLSCPVFECLYEGTRGPGKTDALLMDFAMRTGQGFGPAWRGILFRRTFPELADVITKTKKWFWDYFPAAKFNEAKYTWEWPDGETLLLRHFARVDDYWSYHGHEYPWIGWEELCTWATLEGYRRMMSCCRSSNPDVPRRYRATANPYGPGHNVVKRRFQLPAMSGKLIVGEKDDSGIVEPPRISIHGYLGENQVLLKADPEYKSRLLSSARNDAERKAWINGDWDIVAGGMLDDVWDRRVHVVKPFPIPPDWRIDRSFDWGSASPFSVGWWAEDPGNGKGKKGDLYRIGEWYGARRVGEANDGLRMLATEISQGIREREIAMGIEKRVIAGPADPSIFKTENGMCVANDMARPVLINGRQYSGVRWMPADNTRIAGWEKLRQFLKNALPNKRAEPRERPGLFVFDHCKDCINLLPVLPRDEKKMDDVDTEAEDHIGDEVRYRVAAAASGKVSSGRTVGV